MGQERNRNDLEASVIRRAMLDEDFRKSLLTDPKAAVEAVLREEIPGAKLPATMTVKAFEEPENGLYLIVPPQPGELTEEQLEQVAGGFKIKAQVQIE
jgi:hypothetical protein